MECSFSSEKVVYAFSKTSNGYNFCSSYRNITSFKLIRDRIEFFLQCLLWYCVVVFVVQNLCMLFVKLQTVIIFAPIIETGKIFISIWDKIDFFL